ncbi:SDR family NAD(P)-dependent oxidoreductase [Nocardioides korecus]
MSEPSPSPHPSGHQSRSVVVVGATSGIGLATAQLLSARGDRLVLVARDAGRLREVAATLPGPVEVAVADVTDADQVEAALEACVAAYGRLDAVITSAQPMAYGTVEQVPAAVLRRMTDVAVLGTSHLAQAALPRFRAQGGGHLVVVNSLLAELAVPAMGAYCAAKAGQLALVRTLQVEVRREPGVHVSLVLPGAIDTPIYHQAATYAGSRGSAPPPVISPAAVAEACAGCLDRPRRMVHVGAVNRLAVTGYRFLPAVYDRLAPFLVDRVVLRGPEAGTDEGNLFEPTPAGESLRGGWTLTGRLRRPGSRRAHWRRGV